MNAATEPRTATLLIRDAAVVTSDEAATVHDRGWVVVHGDVIEAVGAGDPPAGLGHVDVDIDGHGCAVMPGMVNGHTHLFQTFFRGLGDDKTLLDWLRDYIWPAASLMTAEEAAAAATIGLLENLRSGATTVIDHQYIHPDPAIDDAVCAVAERLGVRFVLARGWADRNYEPRLQEPIDAVLTRTQQLADSLGVGNRREVFALDRGQCAAQVARGIALSASGRHGIAEHLPAGAKRTVRRFQRASRLNLARSRQQFRGCNLRNRSPADPWEHIALQAPDNTVAVRRRPIG